MEKEFNFAAIPDAERYNPLASVSERVDWVIEKFTQHVWDELTEKFEEFASPVPAYKWNLRNFLALLDEFGEWVPVQMVVNIRVSSQYVTFAPTKPLSGPHPFARVAFDFDVCEFPATEGLPLAHPLYSHPDEDYQNVTYGGISVHVPTWRQVPLNCETDKITGGLTTSFKGFCRIHTNMNFCEPVIRAFCGPRPEDVSVSEWWEQVYNTTGCENSLMMGAVPPEVLHVAMEFVNPTKKLRGHGDVSAVLAVREDTPLEVITELARDKYRKEVRIGAARNPNCPLKIARGVGEKYAEAAVIILEDRDDITPELLRDWADSKWIKVRTEVATHPNTPRDALEALVMDSNEYVRAYAAANPNTPERARTLAHISTPAHVIKASRPF